MKRPTIADLAAEAEVSVSTINRILSGSANVKLTTVQRVQAAAEKIGFYGLGTITDQMRKGAPHYRLGFLLQQSSRDLYQLLGRKIAEACHQRSLEVVDPLIDFVDVLTPENISQRLRVLGEACDAVALIAADHPQIGQTIRELRERGKPVVTYITDQSAPERAAYVGADNWKLGRTAAWFIAQMTQGPGRVAVYIGNHRYQCQDVADASFRSFLREHAPRLTIEESRPTHEDSTEAYRMVRELLEHAEDLAGILIVGGGISGVCRALREVPPARRAGIKLICRDIGPETRKGLSEGLITAALCHPTEVISAVLIQTMIDAVEAGVGVSAVQRAVPFEIVTPENV